MGEFAVKTHAESQFKSCWHAILEIWGNKIQFEHHIKWQGNYHWNKLRTKMVELFGEPDKPTATLDELIEFSMEYFGKDLDALVKYNRESWERRQKYKKHV